MIKLEQDGFGKWIIKVGEKDYETALFTCDHKAEAEELVAKLKKKLDERL